MPRPVAAVAALALVAGCGVDWRGQDGTALGSDPTAPTASGRPSMSESVAADRQPMPTGTSSPGRSSARPSPTEVLSPDPMARARLSIPAIGLRDLVVVPYRGRPDDGPGTRIQNRGPAASPRGPRGGEAPGELGNYIVTAHRTSHTAPFRDLPALRRGDRVKVRVQDTVYVYEITGTRRTSFRSARSLAEQAAAVPGRPGAEPTQAMITLSTCATPEDHAAGNFWSDRFGNPEHRIDKIGTLIRSRPA